MGEIKNSFLQSKMNQDLDDRLLPNGEYREAVNVSIGKSENSDVGTLQNILGNNIIGAPNAIVGMECIGYFMDNNNNRIYQFLTNEGDNGIYPIVHQITVYDFSSLTYIILVQGDFLNFLKLLPISGVNLVESLLFWTDYNNQPRKINVNSALSAPATSVSPYYTTEDQISVAKYAPIEPISLVRYVTTTVSNTVAASYTIPVNSTVGVVPGMTVIADNPTLEDNKFVIVESVTPTSVTVSSELDPVDPPTVLAGTKITFAISTMTDKSSDPKWPGDPAYLKGRYVRFSYRFRLDDGEYTLMAPFTQITFIPNQKGYFIEGNENDAYQSTVLKWFENNVNNILLLIPFPDILSRVNQSYKIQALDILYKESDRIAINVIETIPYTQFSSNTTTNVYEYDYQSRKPYKLLTEDQTTRVYDIVPVKAKAQESAGNRIIYGNFLKNYTAPKSLNYQVSVTRKQQNSLNFIEYPNHTVKQNRTYQVGFVLADKYGRQSSVILSALDTLTTNSGGVEYGGSTVFSPYYMESTMPVVKDWFGNAITLLINTPIASSNQPSLGTPGLYAEPTSVGGFTIASATTITDTTYIFTPTAGVIPEVGDSMRGAFTDYVTVKTISPTPTIPTTYGIPYTITLDGRVNNIYQYSGTNIPPDVKYAYTINVNGWYSYKVVVRQQEQEYYNVYLPGMLNGYPKGQTYGSQTTYNGTLPTLVNGINTTVFPTNETNKVAHTVLINDNINKVPRDLVEVGPDQKLYRSSVQLFGRVENTMIIDPPTSAPNNTQYFPSTKADTAIAIGTASDLSFLPQSVTNNFGSAVYNFYQLETTPLVARISTTNKIGFTAVKNDPPTPTGTYPSNIANMLPYLSVYETKPVYSLLDIFWETSTTGLISDLNADVLTGFEGAVGLSEVNFDSFKETANPNNSTKYITTEFWPVSSTGIELDSTGVSLSVINTEAPIPANVSNSFDIETFNAGGGAANHYRIYIKDNFVFINNTSLTSFVFNITLIPANNNGVPVTYPINGRVENVVPVIAGDPIINLQLGSISVPPLPIYTFTAVNGANSALLNKDELRWSILNTSTPANWASYFRIDTNPTTKAGEVVLLQNYPITTAEFVLNIQVQDATLANGTSTSGTTKYQSKKDNVVLKVSLAKAIICGREWTTKNYNGITYQDETPIPYISNGADWANATTGAWCYYGYTAANASYGLLYNGYATQGIWDAAQPNNRKQFAPNGYRIPFTYELCILNCIPAHNPGGFKATGNLTAGTGLWQAPNTGATNVTGFNAIPAGQINANGTFSYKDQLAVFHSKNPDTDLAGIYGSFGFTYNNLPVGPTMPFDPKRGYSVRFVDNNIETITVVSQFGNCQADYVDQFGNPQSLTVQGDQGGGSGELTTCAPCTIVGNCI